MKSIFFYDYPLCWIGIAEEDGAICRVFFTGEEYIVPGAKLSSPLAGFILSESPLIKKAAAQLTEYFYGKRKEFDLPLSLHGTDFQISVWKALEKIPYGKTCSYGELAASVGNPKACRAVGMANNRNPIVIIIPCHRVIGSDGTLTGYGGGLTLKRQILELESK